MNKGSRVILGEEIKWVSYPEGVAIEGECGYHTGLNTPADWDSRLTSIAAGRIMEKNSAILDSQYNRDKAAEENKYKAALDREAILYETNMKILKKHYDEAMKELWKIYHQQGGRWDWDKRTGKFLNG